MRWRIILAVTHTYEKTRIFQSDQHVYVRLYLWAMDCFLIMTDLYLIMWTFTWIHRTVIAVLSPEWRSNMILVCIGGNKNCERFSVCSRKERKMKYRHSKERQHHPLFFDIPFFDCLLFSDSPCKVWCWGKWNSRHKHCEFCLFLRETKGLDLPFAQREPRLNIAYYSYCDSDSDYESWTSQLWLPLCLWLYISTEGLWILFRMQPN